MTQVTSQPVADSAASGKPGLIDVTKVSPEQAVARLIGHSVEMGASDIFFTTHADGLVVQVRRLGMVQTISKAPGDMGKRCIAHIKARASMDISEKRRPLDGRWIYDRGDGAGVDLRINSIPTLYGEDLAMRILLRDRGKMRLEQIGMGAEQIGRYRAMINSPGGLVLVTGPTGSGKTATLYASLGELADGTKKVNTIEDPIEFAVDGLRQSQVNPAIDLGFLDLLRSVLRQNPDVIMIGEIRDAETAKTAVHAANSGILVFATLHAPAAAGAVQTMRSLGAHPHFLAASLRGVVAQRLARTLCPHCRQSFDVADAPQMFEEVRPWLGPDEGKLLCAAGGCDKCGMSGYGGQTGVFELMDVSPAVRSLISESRPAREIRTKAVEEGMLQFRQSALLKVARGETTTEEIFRIIPSESLMHED
jgi:general secretion pathway protein E